MELDPHRPLIEERPEGQARPQVVAEGEVAPLDHERPLRGATDRGGPNSTQSGDRTKLVPEGREHTVGGSGAGERDRSIADAAAEGEVALTGDTKGALVDAKEAEVEGERQVDAAVVSEVELDRGLEGGEALAALLGE